MEKMKAITNIPGWSDKLNDADKVTTTNNAFAMVPLIFRAVRYRCNALSSVPMQVVRGENEVDWPFPVNLENLIWKTEASMLLEGAAYWLKETNKVRPTDLMFLNPTTIEVEYDDIQGWTFKQQTNIGTAGPWSDEEIVYFREYDPAQDTHPGVAATKVALVDSRLLHYTSRFASYFFEGGAQPITILGLENNVSDTERERVETMIGKTMRGIKNAFRVIGLRTEINPHTLTPPISDLAMPELNDQARQNIADAFDIPIPLLENPANRSVTEELRLSFWQDTMLPRGKMISGVINDQLLKPIGFELKMNFNEMDIFQEDEAERAGSLRDLVDSKFPLDLAAEVLGYDLDDEQWERLRASMEKEPEPEPGSDNGNMMRKELRRWERSVIKQLKQGKAIAEVESDIIPASMLGAISGSLDGVSDVREVGPIFANAIRWSDYP